MNHSELWRGYDDAPYDMKTTRRVEKKAFSERFEPFQSALEPYYDDEAVIFPNLVQCPTPQLAMNRDELGDSYLSGSRHRLSIEYDAPVHRSEKRHQQSKSPEHILMKYGIINPKNTTLFNFREMTKRSSRQESTTLDKHESLQKQSHDSRFDEVERGKRERSNNSLDLKASDSKGKKVSEGLPSPFVITRKQLNPKYNYVNLETLEKEESIFYELAQKRLKEFHDKAAERAQLKMPALQEYRDQMTHYASNGSRQARQSIEFRPVGGTSSKEQLPSEPARYPKARAKPNPHAKRNNRVFTPWKDTEDDDLSSLVQ